MAKYMLLLCGADQAKVLANREVSMKRYEEWTNKLIAEKKFCSAHKLKDGEGRKVSSRSGSEGAGSASEERPVFDGPYTETKETVGGFYIIECDTYDEAVEIAKECPVVLYQGGYVEIRKIEI
jgi:hypothetical protein